MRRWMLALSLLTLAIAGAPAAPAEVVDAQPGGFTVTHALAIHAAPRRVWDVLVAPRLWWSSAHTFSGSADHLTLSPVVGGAWLEALPSGGGVRHMSVVWVDPPANLRLEGALGPLQALGVTGHLTFVLKADGADTIVTETYDVGGHAPGGLQGIAGPVDHVLGEGLARLKAAVEAAAAP